MSLGFGSIGQYSVAEGQIVALQKSNLSWVQQNKELLRRPTRPRKYFFYKLRYGTRRAPYVYPIDGHFQVPSNLSWVQPNKTVLRHSMHPRSRRFYYRLKWDRQKPPHVYPVGAQFLTPSNLPWKSQPANYKLRGKSKRLRLFFVWRALKLKPTWFKVDYHGQVLPEGQSAVFWRPQPANYKLRGKSKRLRIFFVWRALKLKPTWFKVDITGQVQPEGKSAVFWKSQPANYKLRGKPKRTRFFYRVKWDRQKVPHVYAGTPPAPSNLTFVPQNKTVRRKPMHPRSRRYFGSWLRAIQQRKPPHVYPKGSTFLSPSNLTWQQQNREVLRKPMKPRRRFRIMGRYPHYPSDEIDDRFSPKTKWVLLAGPGRSKKRLAQPKLDSTERVSSPRLQK